MSDVACTRTDLRERVRTLSNLYTHARINKHTYHRLQAGAGDTGGERKGSYFSAGGGVAEDRSTGLRGGGGLPEVGGELGAEAVEVESYSPDPKWQTAARMVSLNPAVPARQLPPLIHHVKVGARDTSMRDGTMRQIPG